MIKNIVGNRRINSVRFKHIPFDEAIMKIAESEDQSELINLVTQFKQLYGDYTFRAQI